MGYPYDQITENERVLLHQRPHWKVLILPTLAGAAALGAAIYVAVLVSTVDFRQALWIALAAISVPMVLRSAVVPWLRWLATHVVITSDQVMCREGVIKRTAMSIPLGRITSVSTEIDLNDRIFGCGTLVIESASAPIRFTDIPDVEHVRHLLYQAMEGTALASTVAS